MNQIPPEPERALEFLKQAEEFLNKIEKAARPYEEMKQSGNSFLKEEKPQHVISEDICAD